MNNQLLHIKPLSWEEVFSAWRDGEATLPHWIEHYKKRGFNSWEEWRRNAIMDLRPETLAWKLYTIDTPQETIPQLHGGPFRTWIKNYYNGNLAPTFAEIVSNPAFDKNKVIDEIIQNFPVTSTLIGLQTDVGIVIIEGMHRCCAVAEAQKQEIVLNTSITIALADFTGREVPVMGQVSSPTI